MTAPPKLTWVEGIAELTPIFDRWQELVVRIDSEIFLSPQWLKAWWPQLGRGRKLVALVAEAEGRLVGLLPFMIDRVWVGPLPINIGRFAATDPHCMVLTLPVEPVHLATMLAAACKGLLENYGCAAISLTPVSDLADFLPAVLDLVERTPSLVLTRQEQGTHCVFTLPDSFEGFLATQLSSNRRGQFRRKLAGMKEEFNLQSSTYTPTDRQFDDFVTFHNIQWQAVGKGGHFTDWPGSQASYRALGGLTDATRGLRFFDQTGNEGPLSIYLCFMSGKTCHWRLPARTLDPRAEKLSIGMIGLILMIEGAIAAGVTRIEGGRGVYDYKTAHGGQNVPVQRILISRNSAKARALLRLALAWSDMMDFLYYRVWFKKIAPAIRRKTGLPARPLWRLWIGSRL